MNAVKIFCKFFVLLITFSMHAAGQNIATNVFFIAPEEVIKSRINCLYQTADGFILCGTSTGLYSFDGNNFNLYSSEKKNTSVTAIIQHKDKRIWVGYDNGSLGELKNGAVTPLNFAEGNPKVAINSFVFDTDGVLWMATAGEGIYYYANKKWYNINSDDGLSDDYVYKLIYMPGYGVIASTDRGINFCKLINNKKSVTAFTSKNGLPDNIVRSIAASGKDKLIAGMQDAGICFLSMPGKTISASAPWKYGTVNDIIQIQSKVYVSTGDSSLMMAEVTNSNSSPSFRRSEALQPGFKISCMIKDRESNLWVAGENMLARVNTVMAEKIRALSSSVSEKIHCLYACSDTCLWVNSESSVIKMTLHNGAWENKTYNLPLPGNAVITSLYKDVQNNIWAGTLGYGMIILNPVTGKTSKLYDKTLPANANIISVSGKNNQVWVSALEGVVQLTLSDTGIRFTDYTDPAGIGSKYVYDIFIDHTGRTWFATDGDGVYMLDKGRFSNLKNMKGYMGDVVYKILEDAKGNIWYATYDKGVVKYDGKSFANYTAENGLSDASVTGLLKMGVHVAVMHKNSIDIINAFNNNSVSLNNTSNVSAVNTDLNACTSNGADKLYFASADGIYSFQLAEGVVHSPSVFITRVDLFLRPISAQNGYRFSHNQNNIGFYFTGLDYSQPENLHYQYKLDGYDKNWISTSDNYKNFPRLPPGGYTFRVRVSANKNFLLAEESSFSFEISNPFWLQWWFIVLCVVLVAGTMYGIIKLREKRIKKWDEMEKDKIQSKLETLRSQINPHFLFNSFNTLVSEIESNPEKAVEYTETLSDFYRYIVMYRDKDLITLGEEIEVLKNYYYLQKKRFADGFTLNLDIPEENSDKYSMAPLVLQLLVENAIKHNIISSATPLQVDIYKERDDYIVVRNNINRKIQPEKGSGMGLQNIQNRYKYLSDKPIEFILSEKNFTAKIPLIKNVSA